MMSEDEAHELEMFRALLDARDSREDMEVIRTRADTLGFLGRLSKERCDIIYNVLKAEFEACNIAPIS
jgi:hypothetical protein